MQDYLENYGIKLEKLSYNKIELVRRWRNDPKISQYMEFQSEISPEMQEKWFKSIDNDANLYYIIIYNHEEIGLINIKDIDTRTGCGESGVFIYCDKYLNTDISYRAHLVLFDYYFLQLGYESIKAHVRAFNKRASRFSAFLGCKQINTTDFFLTKEDYLSNKNRERFLKKFNILSNKTHE